MAAPREGRAPFGSSIRPLMTTPPSSRHRSLGRVAALFAITLGAYWPLWLVQAAPLQRAGAAGRRGRIAIAAAALIPVLNIAFEVVLALFLPRTIRRMGETANTETQAFLLLAAPTAAIALTLALSLPFWLAGYLAWPLELPAALAVQSALNRLGAGARMDGEVALSGLIGIGIVTGVVLLLVLGGGGDKKSAPAATRQQVDQVSDIAVTPGALWVTR